ncbi:tRNA(Met) cytidine acetyltransferase TmcA [Halomicrobium salinisoli]|uniref:tRNA(Met) cytidine acetyltransferase TmcA n=1 Tax=Halomicrobium salinisoli TaxID=2878391 RepID=UPI001CF062AE|nr:tRNA(Met) cytidine acetyltransferase TmcA [Halomicrobium salinisoli]
MELAADLRAEARFADERRVLVLAGAPDATRSAAADALDAAEIARSETTSVGPEPFLAGCEHLEPVHASDLLGRTREAVVLDCRDDFRPNALGRCVGAVDGGGLLVLLTPPLDEWPGRRRPEGGAAERASGEHGDPRADRRDAFDASLAVPPFEVSDVTGNFRRRLVETIRAHPGIAIVDVDGDEATVEKEGLTDPAPRLPATPPAVPADTAFPAAAYEACLTDDQVDAVAAFESLLDGGAVVVEADRGRGKSSAAGLAAASLALAGRDVLVTAPQYRSAREVFARAEELLTGLDALEGLDHPDAPQHLRTSEGRVRYADATSSDILDDDPDVVIVDEAAALPVRVLERFLDAPAVAFTTTVHGYEGAGRGFSVRFRDRLAESGREVTERAMTAPIRYAAGDPVESWAFRALLLDARPAVDPLVADATPESATYERLDADALLADEHLLREAFGLLVLAHYRTEPNDLARLLDAPNVKARALIHDGHVVSVALLAREGDLPADLRADMYGGGRVKGNMLPDVLTTQLRDEDAGVPVGQRVLRIATHPAARSRGLGSRLLAEVESEFADAVDWLGVGYGATPELVDFWAANGYATVHLSTTRNDASGEYSAVMLRPTSDAGRDLADRHAEWFVDRIAAVLSDPLDDLDPDVARAALATAGATPTLDLSEFEWRLLAGVPGGAATFDTAPGPFRALAVRHLVATAADLTPDAERLLVRKVLQARPWDGVADELGFVSTAECMRALGRTVEKLVRVYGDDTAREELDRHGD